MEKQQEDNYPKHGIAPTDPETGLPGLHWGTLRLTTQKGKLNFFDESDPSFFSDHTITSDCRT